MSERRYFFIVGSPRSGTTLLQAMLMRAPGVFVPAESKYMSISWDWREELGDITTDKGWARLERIVRTMTAREEVELDWSTFDRAVREGPRSYATMLRAWMDAVADHEGASVIGEKSPSHTAHVVRLLAMIPGSRAIHITRDPRDVAMSQREVWRRPLLQGAVRWRLDAALHAEYAQLLAPERYTHVRYEDLVTEPEGTLRLLAGFLGIEFTPEMLTPGEREKKGFSAREKHKLQTLQAVTPSRIGRYRGTLRKWEIAIVERVCAQGMRAMGYERETGPLLGTIMVALAAIPTSLAGSRRSRRRHKRLRKAEESGA